MDLSPGWLEREVRAGLATQRRPAATRCSYQLSLRIRISCRISIAPAPDSA